MGGAGLNGMMMTRKTKKESDSALQGGQLGQTFGEIENLTQSYDDLVRTGIIPAGSYYHGLSGGESRLGRAMGDYQETLGQDPVFAKYRDATLSRLQGIDSGIPNDLRRSITEELRQSQAQRGIIDSNVGATEEVVRLMGGQESLTNARLDRANQYFRDVTSQAMNALLPNINTLYGGELQRSIERSKGARESAQTGSQFTTGFIGGVI